MLPITDHVAKTGDHETFYLACGAEDAPLIIFVHGWPELSISWRHQLPAFAALGFRAVAPDMRGYGRSTLYKRHEDYAVEHSVADMLALLRSLGREKAIWVGHDWGSPVAWSLASHHPENCVAIANLCVPYAPKGFAPANLVPQVDRAMYPEASFPVGQWDYQLFYEENFDEASAAFEADIPATVRAIFRRGDPSATSKPARTASIRRDGGWFGGSGRAPDVPRDASLISETDYRAYVAALDHSGFFGPDSWYMNGARNTDYALRAKNNANIDLPCLFVHAAYDSVCETLKSSLAQPMRDTCRNLTEVVVESGHWMAQEQPVAVNQAIVRFLVSKVPRVMDAAKPL